MRRDCCKPQWGTGYLEHSCGMGGRMNYLRVLLVIFSSSLFAAEPNVWTVEIGGLWSSSKAVHFTGFGPFGWIRNNPSGRVAGKFAAKVQALCPEGLASVKSSVLTVRPGIIETIQPEEYSTVISVGVSAGSSAIRIERYAQNWYEGDSSAGVIDPKFPAREFLEGPRIPPRIPSKLEGFAVEAGEKGSGGTFVCNDTFFRLIRKGEKGYFIHIPNVAPEQDEAMATALAQIACYIFGDR
jgi:pyrrolidone-carboxylate peptidase